MAIPPGPPCGTPLSRSPTPRGSIEQFFGRIAANLEHRGEGRAYYSPSTDLIVLPLFETFSDAGAYYATRAHEMIHRTGHETRLARSLANRFGSAAHAVEELIAELGAAFTCATIGISPTPRPDQAFYLAVTRDGRRRRRRGRAMATFGGE